MTVLLVRCCFIVDAVGSISQKLNGKTGVSTISRNSPLQMPIYDYLEVSVLLYFYG